MPSLVVLIKKTPTLRAWRSVLLRHGGAVGDTVTLLSLGPRMYILVRLGRNGEQNSREVSSVSSRDPVKICGTCQRFCTFDWSSLDPFNPIYCRRERKTESEDQILDQ